MRFLGRIGMAVVIAVGLSSSAAARRTISYSGTAVFHSYSTLGFPIAGLVDGPASFTGTFYYDDALKLLGATTRVGGVVRGSFTCPVAVGFCPPLSLTATGIGSAVATTPEDGMQLGVNSPSGFGGIDFLAPHRVVYAVLPGDDSGAFVTWAAYDGPLGFAYSVGDGAITRVESAVPEPGVWALMIVGFAVAGTAMRRTRAIATRP